MKTVGIIGAGAAGLCALRHVLDTPGLTPLIWDQSKEIGGTWVYTDKTDKDEFGLPIHSSMYKLLRTNLPKEIMGFPDFPFPTEGQSYIHHTEVLKYLHSYAEHFGLMAHIKFNHVVQEVSPLSPGKRNTAWKVVVRDLTANSEHTHHCDSLLICNGHYSEPNIPLLPNASLFEGTLRHSHCYRDPLPYKDRVVAVLGAAASGVDVALEVASVARQVYLCHNLPVPYPSKMPSNLEQHPGITCFKLGASDAVVLKDGTELRVDDIIYCTGYLYTFPFLSPECGITVAQNQVRPLYRHMIHCLYPTMAFIGIPFQVCPFPLFHFQVLYFLHVTPALSEDPSTVSTADSANSRHRPCVLLSQEAMLVHTKADREAHKARGKAERHYHKLGDRQWGYCDELIQEAAMLNVRRNPVIEDLYKHVHFLRSGHLCSYKNLNYAVTGTKFRERVLDSFGL